MAELTTSQPPADTTARPAKIELQGISKRFSWVSKGVQHDVQALEDVSLSIHENEFLTMIGPSGCGKTTLLRILASLTPPDVGQVLIDGKPVTKPAPGRAMVFQSFGLLPWKTVLENVKFPLTIRKVSDRDATEIAQTHLRKVRGALRLTDRDQYDPVLDLKE